MQSGRSRGFRVVAGASVCSSFASAASDSAEVCRATVCTHLILLRTADASQSLLPAAAQRQRNKLVLESLSIVKLPLEQHLLLKAKPDRDDELHLVINDLDGEAAPVWFVS